MLEPGRPGTAARTRVLLIQRSTGSGLPIVRAQSLTTVEEINRVRDEAQHARMRAIPGRRSQDVHLDRRRSRALGRNERYSVTDHGRLQATADHRPPVTEPQIALN